MTPFEATFVAIAALWFILMAIVAFRVWQKIDEDRCRYKLFDVRDRINLLVVEGALERDSAIYEVVYGLVNATLRDMRDVTPKQLAAAYLEYEKRTLTPTTQMRRFREELKTADPRVLEALDSYFGALISILKRNSPALRMYLWAKPLAELAPDWARFGGLRTIVEAYRSALSRQATVEDAMEPNNSHATT